MFHYRKQLFTQFNGKLCNSLTRLIKSCLDCIVLHVELFGHGSTLFKSLCRFLLFPLHHFKISCQCRNHLSSTGTVLAHVLEDRSQDVDVAKIMKSLNEHQQSLVGTALQCLIELLSVQASRLYYLVLLLEHIHNQLGKSRCRHFHSLPLRIKNGSEAHDLRNCHVRLCSDTSHTLCKLGKVRSRCRTVLRQLVYHRTYREQGTLGTQTFLIPEDSTQFRKNQGSPISQIIESHVDLVGSADEAKNILL